MGRKSTKTKKTLSISKGKKTKSVVKEKKGISKISNDNRKTLRSLFDKKLRKFGIEHSFYSYSEEWAKKIKVPLEDVRLWIKGRKDNARRLVKKENKKLTRNAPKTSSVKKSTPKKINLKLGKKALKHLRELFTEKVREFGSDHSLSQYIPEWAKKVNNSEENVKQWLRNRKTYEGKKRGTTVESSQEMKKNETIKTTKKTGKSDSARPNPAQPSQPKESVHLEEFKLIEFKSLAKGKTVRQIPQKDQLILEKEYQKLLEKYGINPTFFDKAKDLAKLVKCPILDIKKWLKARRKRTKRSEEKREMTSQKMKNQETKIAKVADKRKIKKNKETGKSKSKPSQAAQTEGNQKEFQFIKFKALSDGTNVRQISQKDQLILEKEYQKLLEKYGFSLNIASHAEKLKKLVKCPIPDITKWLRARIKRTMESEEKLNIYKPETDKLMEYLNPDDRGIGVNPDEEIFILKKEYDVKKTMDPRRMRKLAELTGMPEILITRWFLDRPFELERRKQSLENLEAGKEKWRIPVSQKDPTFSHKMAMMALVQKTMSMNKDVLYGEIQQIAREIGGCASRMKTFYEVQFKKEKQLESRLAKLEIPKMTALQKLELTENFKKYPNDKRLFELKTLHMKLMTPVISEFFDQMKNAKRSEESTSSTSS